MEYLISYLIPGANQMRSHTFQCARGKRREPVVHKITARGSHLAGSFPFSSGSAE